MVNPQQMKGEPFLRKLGVELTGRPPGNVEEEEAAIYGKKTKAAEAKAEFRETLERLDNPPSLRELQAKREQETTDALKEERARAQRLEEERMAKLDAERAAAAMAAEEERQKREKAEAELREQRDRVLFEKLEELKSSNKSPLQQISEYMDFAEKVAEKMGLQKPQEPRPGSGDSLIQLEIAKIESERAEKDREFKFRMDQANKQWELELEKFKDEREARKMELARQEKKDEMMAAWPSIIGEAFAKGVVNSSIGSGGGISARPNGAQQSKPTRTYRLEAYEGDSGETICPNCKSPVAIEPTTVEAVCINCDSKYEISRVPVPAGEKPAQPAPEIDPADTVDGERA